MEINELKRCYSQVRHFTEEVSTPRSPSIEKEEEPKQKPEKKKKKKRKSEKKKDTSPEKKASRKSRYGHHSSGYYRNIFSLIFLLFLNQLFMRCMNLLTLYRRCSFKFCCFKFKISTKYLSRSRSVERRRSHRSKERKRSDSREEEKPESREKTRRDSERKWVAVLTNRLYCN